MGTLFVGIRGYTVLESFVPAGSYYGEALPDSGFIQLEVQQLPALQLSEDAFSLRRYVHCDSRVPSRNGRSPDIREDFAGHAVLAARHREQCAPVSLPLSPRFYN